jgi:hypothetical protein
MATIEVHEPEVIDVKRADRSGSPLLPRADLVLGKAIAPRAMFSDSPLEVGQQRKRRALTTTTSFIFNCLAVGVMLITPLLFTEGLPKPELLTFLVAPPPPRRLRLLQPHRWRASSGRFRLPIAKKPSGCSIRKRYRVRFRGEENVATRKHNDQHRRVQGMWSVRGVLSTGGHVDATSRDEGKREVCHRGHESCRQRQG